jgi:hypothetical protein
MHRRSTKMMPNGSEEMVVAFIFYGKPLIVDILLLALCMGNFQKSLSRMLQKSLLWAKRLLLSVFLLFGLLVVGLMVTDNSHVFTGFSKTYLIGKPIPDIDDMPMFDVSNIQADLPVAWPLSPRLNQTAPSKAQWSLMESMETTAFLVFHKDTLLFEQYWLDGGRDVVNNSFSMAKSFTSMMIGKAIDEGYIQSIDQPVGDFLAEFKDGKNGELTIRHLLSMTSGIPFGEDYGNPLGYMAKAYYGNDLLGATKGFSVERTPGTFWAYEGGNTVLLGMIIKEVTGRTPSEYFFQKFWSCIGAEKDAHWNLDKPNGFEKTFSGFYATARDYARVGKLMMNRGIWQSDTLLSPSYIDECFKPCMAKDEDEVPCTWYGLQWWMGQHQGLNFQSARGLRGQYIIMIPELDLLVVRLGHKEGKERVAHMPSDLLVYIEAARNISGQ